MATISSALNFALGGLSASAAQSALVARNVSSAGDENYTRKTAQIYTLPGGAPTVTAFSRSTDRQLLDKLLTANSDAAGRQVTLDALNRMSALSGDPEDGQSVAAALGRLQQSLSVYETNPSSMVLAGQAVESARAVAAKLNGAAAEVAQMRSEADRAISDSVERVNNLLAQFKVVNDSIVRGQGTAMELAETLDQRDAILKQLSEELSLRTTARPNNDLLIYAEGGAVLFEGSPRAIAFSASEPLQPGLAGNPVLIDGVPVTGEGAAMAVPGGKLAALARLRDGFGLQFSTQLDQIAAGLVRGFAERDPAVPATLPEVAGLFLGDGNSLPGVSAPPPGLAARLRINSLADAEQGGSALLLRDGGFGGAAYIRNTMAQPAYQARIAELADALDTAQGFGQPAGIGGTVSLKALSIQSSGWIEAARQSAQKSHDVASATRARAGDSLARVTGGSIDQEMAALLDLEKSYQASSKVLATVDAMLAALMEAVR